MRSACNRDRGTQVAGGSTSPWARTLVILFLMTAACDHHDLDDGPAVPLAPADTLINEDVPKAWFNAHHNRLLAGSEVHFFDLSGNDPVFLCWDFGDGATSKAKNPVHAYQEPGSYTVTLIAGNPLGSDTLVRAGFITIAMDTDSTVHDADGNIYTPVSIGEQTWLKENMKATRYTSGDPLQDGKDAGNLDYDTISRYYFAYDDQDSNISTYGRLYTWPAAMGGTASGNGNPSGVQGICPEGYHLPSDAEWMQLELFLGMAPWDVVKNKARGDNEGGMLKEKGTAHWLEPNQGASDDHGFSALPAGERFWSGVYRDKRKRGSYWSSTKFQHNAAWQRWLYHKHGMINRSDFSRISVGASVRCVKD